MENTLNSVLVTLPASQALPEQPVSRFQKIWTAISVLFNLLDAETLINFTSVSHEHHKYKGYAWKLLFNRQNKDYILNHPSKSMNFSQINFRAVYLQLDSLGKSLSSSNLINKIASENYVETVDLLATLNPNIVNERYGNNCTALGSAIQYAGLRPRSRWLDMVNVLLKHGADTESHHVIGLSGRAVQQCSALMLAAACNEDCMRALLDHPNAHVNINAVDEFGRTTLIQLIDSAERCDEGFFYKGRLRKIKCLIEHGADLNIVTTEGKTALIYAAEIGRVDIIRLLLTPPPPFIPAQVNFRDQNNMTALMVAEANGYIEAAQYLTEVTRAGMLMGCVPNAS